MTWVNIMKLLRAVLKLRNTILEKFYAYNATMLWCNPNDSLRIPKLHYVVKEHGN